MMPKSSENNHQHEKQVWHIACPHCGGTLPRPQGEQILDCRYCGGRCLLRGEAIVPRLAVRPKIGHADVRAILTPLMTNMNTPSDMIDRATPSHVRLFFVPFFEISGKKGSIRKLKRAAKWDDKESEIETTYDLLTMSAAPDRLYQERRGRVRDTVVSLTDFYDFMPACSMPGFGVESARVADARSHASDMEVEVRPFDALELNRMGTVVSITRSLASFEQSFDQRMYASSGSGEVDIIESHTGIVYYPLFRVTIQYGNREYPATIDGVTGDVINARLPEAGKVRAPMAVVFSLWTGMWIGLIVRSGIYAIVNPESFTEVIRIDAEAGANIIIYSLIVLAVVSFGTLLIFSVAWDHVRYEGEYVVKGSSTSFERVGRPEKTLLDKISMGLTKSIDSGFYKNDRYR